VNWTLDSERQCTSGGVAQVTLLAGYEYRGGDQRFIGDQSADKLNLYDVGRRSLNPDTIISNSIRQHAGDGMCDAWKCRTHGRGGQPVSLGIGNCGVDCGDRCAAEIAVPRSPDPTRPFSDNSYTTFTSVPPACLLSTYLQGSSATRYFAG